MKSARNTAHGAENSTPDEPAVHQACVTVWRQMRLCKLRGLIFELKLQTIGDQGDKLRIGRLALRVRHGIAEKPLQRLQITTVPRDLDRMADGAFHAARRGGKGLCDLRVEDFRDGVSLPDGKQGGLTSAAEKQGCV